MLDIAYIQKNKGLVQKAINDKNLTIDLEALLALDGERKKLVQELSELQRQRNDNAAEIQRVGGKPDAALVTKGKVLKEKATALEPKLKNVEERYLKMMLLVPNVPSDDTPVGADESGNVVLRKVGKIPKFAFKPKEHWELGEALGVLDFERASKVSGSRFAYLRGALAQMEFALVQYCLGVVTDKGRIAAIAKKAKLAVAAKPFVPVIPPALIKQEPLERMARLEPREERYHIESDDLYLVGSAEHTLGPLHMDETMPEDVFPIRYIGFSSAFRREAGSYGKDVKGILRVHQFDKLEFESFTTPETGRIEQDLIVAVQEHLLHELDIPYQVVQICTGDMGGPDHRQIDIECWLPGQGRYRETHTSDYMTDYQARRLATRIKRASGTIEYAHMNDATAFAIGRTLIAIMENYQRADGTILIPKALQAFMGGQKHIGK